MDKEEELKFKDQQIEELKEIISGTIKANGSFERCLGFPQKLKGEINTSSILTKLIQEAGRWCEHYASDLFVEWKCVIDKKLENGTLESDTCVFAFRESGVDCKEQYELHKSEDNYYRAVWFLDIVINKNKIEMILHK